MEQDYIIGDLLRKRIKIHWWIYKKQLVKRIIEICYDEIIQKGINQNKITPSKYLRNIEKATLNFSKMF